MNPASESWPFDVRALTPKLGAAISGLKLADGLTDESFRALYRAFLRYQVLLFPPQDLPPARQVGSLGLASRGSAAAGAATISDASARAEIFRSIIMAAS